MSGIAALINAFLMFSSINAVVPCTLTVEHPSGEDASWSIIMPVPFHHDILSGGSASTGLLLDTLLYSVHNLSAPSSSVVLVPGESGVPGMGTFYVSWLENLPDTLRLVNPPHRQMESTVRVSLRPDDGYTGFLFEHMNTPFIMAPRHTPDGSHQSDERLGTDCAGLAVYGKRRQGFPIPYAGPAGITEFLAPLGGGAYSPVAGGGIWVFINSRGDTARVGENGLRRGDVLHFGAQVSVFYEDRGIPGVLDSDDLLIQSWFLGTHVCMIKENGFFGMPVRLYRWAF